MKRVIYVTDMNMGGADSAEQAVPRSGYANIGMELCRGLHNLGYEVKVLGLGYTGQEHGEPFSIIPCNTLQDTGGYMNNLKITWGAEIIIVALDIHRFQESIFPAARKLGLKYICITPLESDPLCITWANLLGEMEKVFFISEFGTKEAQKAGVKAEHLDVGIDTKAWRLRTHEEYEQVRNSLGIDSDEFVVMTVADNQERKALGRGFQILANLKNLHGVKIRHILVTREHSQVGWKLYDLAYELDLSSELRVFQSGMPFADLYTLYCAADAYLSCSKGEGLGVPVMESMAIGIPVVANTTGALTELLSDDRGWLVKWDSWYYDPFGNQRRYDISVDDAVEKLLDIKNNPEKTVSRMLNARKFMEGKDWKKSIEQVAKAIEEL